MIQPERELPIISDSKHALKALAQQWFDMLDGVHRSPGLRYLVVTIEQTSGLAYAPITNIDKKLLELLDSEYAVDLLRGIREDVFSPLHLRGPIRDLFRSVRGLLNDGDLLAIELLPHERSGQVSVTTEEGDLVSGATEKVVKFLDEYPIKLPQFGRRMDSLRSRATEQYGSSVSAYLLVRTEALLQSGIPSTRASNINLLQVGFALAPSDGSIDLASACIAACRTSGIAASAALYEKERYYERAARQCAADAVIKYGLLGDIHDQYTRLTQLRNGNAIHIPVIDENRSDHQTLTGTVAETARRTISWYRMPWFDLRPLALTLVARGGWQDYELRALMRAATTHLRQTYWENKLQQLKLRSMEDPAVAVQAPLLLAKDHSDSFLNAVRAILADIGKDWPSVHASGVSIFARSPKLEALMDTLFSLRPVSLTIEWKGQTISQQQVESPRLVLNRISDTIRDGVTARSYKRVVAADTHGDAHLMNLLVDASVPEDPLLVSIDPRSWSPEHSFSREKERLASQETPPLNKESLGYELEGIQYDPAFDLANFLAATSGFHNLAINDLLILDIDSPDNVTIRDSAPAAEPLGKGGGISSAKLIRISEGASVTSIVDQHTCTDAVLREFQYLYLCEMGSDSPDRHFSLNIALLRLWSFAIRKLLSTAATLAKSDVRKATMIYLIAGAYAGWAELRINAAVKQHGLDKEAATATLVSALDWLDDNNH